MKIHYIAFIASASVATQVSASEPLITLQHLNGVYETNQSRGGELSAINASILIESPNGSFHRSKISRSYDATSSPGNKSDKLMNIEYNLGSFWYPKATANDYSIWSGLGHWEFDDSIGIGGSTKRNGKVVYIPLGFEGATPISYPSLYFVYGTDIKAVVTGTIDVDGTKDQDASGFGYSVWFGADYQFNDGTIFEVKFFYDKIEIDSSGYELSSNNLSAGYRF